MLALVSAHAMLGPGSAREMFLDKQPTGPGTSPGIRKRKYRIGGQLASPYEEERAKRTILETIPTYRLPSRGPLKERNAVVVNASRSTRSMESQGFVTHTTDLSSESSDLLID